MEHLAEDHPADPTAALALARSARRPGPDTPAGRPVPAWPGPPRPLPGPGPADLDLGALLRLSLAATDASGRLRPTPSAGALHPVDTTLVVGAGCSLPPGRYGYDPLRHRVHHLGPQPAGTPPGLTAELSVTPRRTTSHYGHRAWPLLLLDTGHAAAALFLAAGAVGTGTPEARLDGRTERPLATVHIPPPGGGGSEPWGGPPAGGGGRSGGPVDGSDRRPGGPRPVPDHRSAGAPAGTGPRWGGPVSGPDARSSGRPGGPERPHDGASPGLHRRDDGFPPGPGGRSGGPSGTPGHRPGGPARARTSADGPSSASPSLLAFTPTAEELLARRSDPPPLHGAPAPEVLHAVLVAAERAGGDELRWCVAVGGERPGLLEADAEGAGLRRWAAGEARPALAAWAAGQGWIADAGAVLLARGCPSDADGPHIRRAHLRAGFAVHLAHVTARRLGLAARPVGSWQQADLGAALGAAPGQEWIVHGLALGTGTGSHAGPRTGTGTGTRTGTGSRSGTGTGSRTGTGTRADAGSRSGTGTGTRSGTGTRADAGSRSGTGTGTRTATDSRTGTGTRANRGSRSGIGTGSRAGTRTATGSRTGTLHADEENTT
ncbi:nitroreductase [Streptomyces sp. NPDC126499]|uniref:nitroreductase n=1 Tax=Streptomyces sp. NPDC126499 TaxID=3155314 RepID=UPI003317F71B